MSIQRRPAKEVRCDVSVLLDQFGQPVKPTYYDERAAAFVLNCPGIPQEMVAELEHSQRFYEQMSGATLYDADGQRVHIDKPQTVGSTKPFRHPITNKV